MPLRAISNKVVIRPMPSETETSGGILLPDTVQERSTIGEVLSVGPGRLDEKTGNRLPIDLEPGDWVAFGKWAGRGSRPDDPDWEPVPGQPCPQLLIVNEDEILGVIDPPKLTKNRSK